MQPALPSKPPKQPQPGFLYLPPFRVQGISIAGEATSIHVPELDLCFDLGAPLRFAITADVIALTHGHMDHVAALAYYFSQRHFLGCSTGTVICHPNLERPIKEVMAAWVGIERQRTPFIIKTLAPEEEVPLKGNVVLRAFATKHTPHSLGFVAVEKRQKLRPELVGKTQDEIIALKKEGVAITDIHEIPLVGFTGDTAWGDHLKRPDLLKAQVLIAECTFVGDDDDGKADIGKHMHLCDVLELVELSTSENIVLTHLSRRTHMQAAREAIFKALKPADRERVHILMDHRANHARFEKQLAEAGGVVDGATDAE